MPKCEATQILQMSTRAVVPHAIGVEIPGVTLRQRARALLLVGAVSLLVGACATSSESLEGKVSDLPGVTRAEVYEELGDDDVPFASAPKHIMVRMEDGASEEEIMAVFDELAGDVDDGDLASIEVRLYGAKKATLATGEGVHAATAMVRDLVASNQDDQIIRYRRDARSLLPAVELELRTGDFAEIVSVADRYRDVAEIELVQVVANRFILIRDDVNGDPELCEARELFVHRVASRFRLTGATVTGRGALELRVPSADRTALRAYIDRDASSKDLGPIVIR